MVELQVIKEEPEKKCPACGQKIERPIRRDDLRRVVTVFKMAQGFDKDDKTWDRLYFARYTKSAKQLIDFMGGSWEMAADAIQDISEKFVDLGRTYTFETIVTHAAEWKKNWQERNPK